MMNTPATVRHVAEPPSLSNPDLVPTGAHQRTWRWYHFSALWIGMVMCIPSYTVSGSLIGSGMSALQAVLTILLANVIVLIPMLLIGHAGTRYGIPYAVLARASFGTSGAKLPALLRAIVACGWFGIQTWFGGQILLALARAVMHQQLTGPILPGLGINLAQLICFLLFWALQCATMGLESIRKLETWTAPLKIAICFILLYWVYQQTGGFHAEFNRPSQFVEGAAKAGQFWQTFWPSLTAMVGFWATMALNIPDFTRFARSQRDQLLGQAIGLPLPMALIATLSVLVTSATVILYGKAIWDPVELTSRMSGIVVLLALLVLLVDTMCVNLAANLVGPAYDFSALNPQRISYKTGSYITATIGLLMMPWKVLESTQGFIFTWLIGYSALLGPIAGILIVDYYWIRKMRIDIDALYRSHGRYCYTGGWNRRALLAFALGVLPNVPGFLHAAGALSELATVFKIIYTYAWFVGMALSALVYALMMARGE